MDFSLGPAETEWRDRVRTFMESQVRPRVRDYDAQQREGERWKVLPVVEDLKAKARAEGLWNLFMPPSHGATPVDDSFEFDGPGLSNLQYAFCAEEMGRIGWASEVFNCSAPDTGNMEVLHRYGTREQKEEWLRPLMDGEIRSAFLMTEPDVASSDATNIRCSIELRGNEYVDQRPQMVVERGGRPALQGRDPDGQDRPFGRDPQAAVDDPGAARRAGNHRHAAPAGVRL